MTNRTQKHCKQCEEKFQPLRGSQVYCSAKCRYTFFNKKYVDKNKAWREENKEALKEKKKQYYEANKLRILENVKRWAMANPEKRREIGREWRYNNWKKGKYGKEFDAELKTLVRSMFDYCCGGCGIEEDSLDYRLQVHHIDENPKNNDIENLVSLCKPCHLDAHRI